MARVIDIRDQVVVVDLNHPLAGKELNFQGTVVENRPATDDEIQKLIRQLTGEGCGGCGGCEGGEGCNADGEGCGKKGCGNCHQ
jgi:FKBP-type peptidyl-prolyl cis-trans isomerase SlyD